MTDHGQPCDDALRSVGVEEEFLLVSADAGQLVAAGDRVVRLAQVLAGDSDAADHELKQEQAEIGSKPCVSATELRDQLIGRRRDLAAAAASVDARVAALATCPFRQQTSTTVDRRYHRLIERFGAVTGDEQLTCGQHVHVGVTSDDDAVAAVDRLQQWLPTLRALSANSPFWRDRDTGHASYRSMLWDRWPTAGPTQPFGSPAVYRDTVERLIKSGAALDEGAIYFDARCSAKYPTVEIRVADVSTSVERAVMIAALCRALVEESLQRWHAGEPAPSMRPEFARAAAWRAARFGLADRLLVLPGAEPVPAIDAVRRLLDFARPSLQRFGDAHVVDAELDRLFTVGTGADEQRALVAGGADLQELTAWACDRTTE
ncbi:MAG: glutamate--cysteine ligase [Actinomycetota bacterium]|nr:glutamate--cysteine ligase [Actinomycetota bacterium]